jgi:hypothetical protein
MIRPDVKRSACVMCQEGCMSVSAISMHIERNERVGESVEGLSIRCCGQLPSRRMYHHTPNIKPNQKEWLH